MTLAIAIRTTFRDYFLPFTCIARFLSNISRLLPPIYLHILNCHAACGGGQGGAEEITLLLFTNEKMSCALGHPSLPGSSRKQKYIVVVNIVVVNILLFMVNRVVVNILSYKILYTTVSRK